MTTHSPTIDVTQDQPPQPNQHFSPWLRGQTALFVSQISAILGFVLFLASLVYYISHLSEYELLRPSAVKLFVDYAHIVFMTVFILVLIQVLDDNERGSYRVKLVYERVFKEPKEGEEDIEAILETSKKQLKKFKRRFLWFWCGMLCLYVSFACQHSYDLATSEPPKESVYSMDFSFSVTTRTPEGKEDDFKTETSFKTTDKATAPPNESQPPELKILSSDEVWKQLAFPFCVFLFNNFTLMFIFWCFLVMYIRPEKAKKERKYLVGSGAVVVFLTILYLVLVPIKGTGFTANDWQAYSSIFDALSGVINAVVLALLIARLDSKLIGLPSWLISILYSYAAAQPLFLVFELSQSLVLEKIATSVLIFVFVSKIYFFLIIIYALQTGKMLNYLCCFPILRRRAEAHREIEGRGLSVFDRLKALGGATRARKPRRRRPRGERAIKVRSLRGGYLSRISEWLGSTASKSLRSRYSLRVSEWFGWVAIIYFFVSLIGSQVIPKRPAVGGGIQHARLNLLSILTPPEGAVVLIVFAQLAVVSVMIVTLLLVLKENGYGSEKVTRIARSIFNEPQEHTYPIKKAEEQLKKFKKYFLYFWCVTFVLYVVFLLDPETEFGLHQEGSVAHMVELLLYPFLEFLLSCLNLLCIFWCFVVLQSPTFGKSSDSLQSPAFLKRSNIKQKLLINYSIFVVLLIIAIFPLLLFMIGGPELSNEKLTDYATVFNGVVGTLSAVALALLIARMDSKLFDLPSRLIWMLFAYASIQPLFIAFAENLPVLRIVKISVLTAALGLKMCFFLIVAHSLQSGRVLNYLVCFPFLKERVDSIFENQFEIRIIRTEDHLFTVSILKKNQLYYSCEKRLRTRRACDGLVRYLRKRMKDRNAYLPSRKGRHVNSRSHEELGTYWVELRSGQGKLICESLPMRTKEEANDLIAESMDRIPYCKYNRT